MPPRSRRHPGSLLVLLILICGLLVAAGGCRRAGNRSAVALANAGITTAHTLGAYYESLAEDREQSVQMEVVFSSLNGVEFGDEDVRLMRAPIADLRARARMAQRLESTYTALLNLTSYDASREVKGAAEGLGKELGALRPIVGFSVPTSAVTRLSQEIAEWRKTRELKKGSELLVRVNEGVLELFRAEAAAPAPAATAAELKPGAEPPAQPAARAYQGIGREKVITALAVLTRLADKKLLNAMPLPPVVVDTLDVKAYAAARSLDTPEAVNVTLDIARRHAADEVMEINAATAGMRRSLELLVEAHRNFQAKRPLNLDDLTMELRVVQRYLGDRYTAPGAESSGTRDAKEKK